MNILSSILPLKNWFYLTLSAIGLALSFTYSNYSLIAWIAMVPIFIVLFQHHEPRSIFRKSFWFGFVFYLFLLSWLLVLYPLDWLGIEGAKGFYILIAGWISLSAYEALGIGIVGWLWRRIGYRNWIGVIIFSSLWIIMEFIQGQTFLGFTWGRLAVSQSPTPLLIQSASLFGSLFISFLIVLVNGFIALSIVHKNKGHKNYYLLIATIIFTSNFFFGLIHVNKEITPSSTAKVGIIQGNILADEKWEENRTESILQTYLSLSKEASVLNPDILVWPETAVPVDITNSPSVKKEYESLAQELNISFLFGGFERVDGKKYNAVTAMNSSGEIYPHSYYKQHLVPFGEFVPFKNTFLKLLPILGEINRLDEDISPGISSNILTLPYGKVGSMICFESIFPEIARQSTLDGAELIVLVTNDSWYEDSPAIYQHNSQAVLRAVENHRTIARAANTGVSTIITPKGYIDSYIPPLTSGYIVEKVNFYDNKTLYTKVGDIIIVLALGSILIAILFKGRSS